MNILQPLILATLLSTTVSSFAGVESSAGSIVTALVNSDNVNSTRISGAVLMLQEQDIVCNPKHINKKYTDTNLKSLSMPRDLIKYTTPVPTDTLQYPVIKPKE